MPDRKLFTTIALSTIAAATLAAVFVRGRKKNQSTKSGKPTCKVFDDKAAVAKEVCAFVADEAQKSIESRGVFYLAVAGGSLLDSLSGLVDYKSEVDFSKVVLCFANHKCVDPNDSKKGNLAKCKAKFADAAGITRFITPPMPKEGSDGIREANSYAGSLLSEGVPHKKVVGISQGPHSPGFPVLDLVLLGLGADGHVGSNHPMGPAVAEQVKPVAGSPKQGEPSSITLTIESMNAARAVGVVVVGGAKGKKEAVKRALLRPSEQPRGTFPAQLLDSPVFFLDGEAAADL